MKDPFLSTLGAQYTSYRLTKYTPIPELHCILREVVHEPTQALILHVENADPENLFCLSFKTHPSSSSGVAHILEHTVLCGSEKFPVKDPFFAMTRRSLNTYMNALTGADFTCYPAASQVAKDFYNLLAVYLDAVFYPQLKYLSFLQEGCHLAFTEQENPTTPLIYKGVVYNEMKGSMASPDSRLWHALLEALYPDLPYAYNSGGDPQTIPELTYNELSDFHKTYYHPSRCLFFFYGNLPLKCHLDFLKEELWVKGIEPLPPIPPIPKQPRFPLPRFKKVTYPAQGEEDKAQIAWGWLTAPITSQEEVLALELLDTILMDHDGSLVKKALLASNLCSEVEAHLDTEMSEVPYFIVCKGATEDKAQALQEILFTTLEKIAEEGIPPHLIENALHQLEFARTEIGDGAGPFGLTLFLRAALCKQHGGRPEDALQIHALFATLKEHVRSPDYLPALLKKHLLSNPHYVQITLSPGLHLLKQEEETEKKKLQELFFSLSQEKKTRILQESQELSQYQKQIETQSLECLPQIELSDVSSHVRLLPLSTKKAPLPVFSHTCFTNQIIYADLVYTLPPLSQEELCYLPLFCAFLTEIGAGKRDYLANLDYIQAHVGGIYASCSWFTPIDGSTPEPVLTLRTKALSHKVDKLFSLIQDMLLSPQWGDQKRMEELLLQRATGLHNSLIRSALKYAVLLTQKNFSLPSHISELWHGWSHYEMLQKLLPALPEKLPFLQEVFFSLSQKIFSPQNTLSSPHLIVSLEEEALSQLERENYFGLTTALFSPQKPAKKEPYRSSIVLENTLGTRYAYTLASPVAFTAKAYKTVGYLHPHAPALSLATQLLENKVLHRLIREERGAYGSGASYNATSGTFYLHAYRDPHIAKTIETFDHSLKIIAKEKFSEKDLLEAKLGIIQNLDAPLSPGQRAATAYAYEKERKTTKRRQEYRDKLLSCTLEEIRHAVVAELLPQVEKGNVVSFAHQELIERENISLLKDNSLSFELQN